MTHNFSRLPLSISGFFSFLALAIFSLPVTGISQQPLRGKVSSAPGKHAIAYAFVGIKGKPAGIVADSSGNFSFVLPDFIKRNDTVVVSSIGFQPLKMPVWKAIKQEEFLLSELPNVLQNVTVRSFSNRSRLGANQGDFTYYRGWYKVSTGGEIGRVFNIPHDSYKISYVAFNANNNCDTCLVRLHIRKVIHGMPGEELITQSFILPVLRRSPLDRLPVFDLSEYEIILTEENIFVGFEIVNCSGTSLVTNSFAFTGTEYGEHLFKTYAASNWETGPLYNIQISLAIEH